MLNHDDFKLVDGTYNYGWAGEKLAKSEFALIQHLFVPFSSTEIGNQSNNYRGKKMMLFQVSKKVLGNWPTVGKQEIGDCVSWGAKHAIEHLTCCEISINNQFLQYHYIFSPYLYGTGRVFIGKGQMDGDDGSLGSWMAQAVIQYGAITCDDDGVPSYSGRVAKQWGDSPGPSSKFVDVGKKHLIKSASQINSWDNLVAAICNGYPCTVASNQGFSMSPGSDGFHRAQGNWGHQMVFVGIDDSHNPPYAIIENSWGEDAMGYLKDFDTGDAYMGGLIRCHRQTAESMINAGETFAYSQYDGLPDQNAKLEKSLFQII